MQPMPPLPIGPMPIPLPDDEPIHGIHGETVRAADAATLSFTTNTPLALITLPDGSWGIRAPMPAFLAAAQTANFAPNPLVAINNALHDAILLAEVTIVVRRDKLAPDVLRAIEGIETALRSNAQAAAEEEGANAPGNVVFLQDLAQRAVVSILAETDDGDPPKGA